MGFDWRTCPGHAAGLVYGECGGAHLPHTLRMGAFEVM
jgi:hypothetical protein